MTDDDYEGIDLDSHRELVDQLPLRLLPLLAAGLIDRDEAHELIGRARQELADRVENAARGRPPP